MTLLACCAVPLRSNVVFKLSLLDRGRHTERIFVCGTDAREHRLCQLLLDTLYQNAVILLGVDYYYCKSVCVCQSRGRAAVCLLAPESDVRLDRNPPVKGLGIKMRMHA